MQIAGDAGARLGFTSQMVLSASCNCPKTPLAPKSASAIPMMVAANPLLGVRRFAAMFCTTSTALLSRNTTFAP